METLKLNRYKFLIISYSSSHKLLSAGFTFHNWCDMQFLLLSTLVLLRELCWLLKSFPHKGTLFSYVEVIASKIIRSSSQPNWPLRNNHFLTFSWVGNIVVTQRFSCKKEESAYHSRATGQHSMFLSGPHCSSLLPMTLHCRISSIDISSRAGSKRDHRYHFVRIIFGLIPRNWRQWSNQYLNIW